MPSREDERHRNMQDKHPPSCMCADCVEQKKPPRTKLPEPIDIAKVDWDGFAKEIANVKIPDPPPSNPAIRMDLQHRTPLEITERGRRMREDEREERMEREREAGTRPRTKSSVSKTTKSSSQSTSRTAGWLVVFLAAILVFVIVVVIASFAVV